MARPSRTARPRRERSDSLANQTRILDAATVAFKTAGPAVPMATIADQASVGIGTVYRHYPDRTALWTALAIRSYQRVLSHITDASTAKGNGLATIAAFLEATISQAGQLMLPLHGAPPIVNDDIRQLRSQINGALQALLDRGQHDGSIRPDITAADIIIFGAMLAEPLPQTQNWATIARRQTQIFTNGLKPTQHDEDEPHAPSNQT